MLLTEELLIAKKQLKKTLDKERYQHSLGVAYTASSIAMRYGADIEKAHIAGLFHDCAKFLTDEEALAFAEAYHILISESCRKAPGLLHGPIGSFFVKDRYYIGDPEIQSAIYYHTIGKPQMTLLEQIIYVADFIEPNRRPYEGITELRKAAFTDIDLACYLASKGSNDAIIKRGGKPAPESYETLNFYKESVKNRI